MKRITLSVVLLLGMITNSFAQQMDTSPVLTREDYLKKSKEQRAGSVLLVLAGVTVVVVGGTASAVSAGGNKGPSFPIVPVALGVGCVVGAGALSKASSRNKKKALDASAHINLQRVPNFPFTAPGKPSAPIPAFTLKLNLH